MEMLGVRWPLSEECYPPAQETRFGTLGELPHCVADFAPDLLQAWASVSHHTRTDLGTSCDGTSHLET